MNFHKFLQIPKRLRGKSKGFTLIETLVATSIFIITMVIISQIYISAMRAERITYALIQNQESVRYALDTISKTIRMGKGFDVSDDGKELKFRYDYLKPGEDSALWKPIVYSFDQNTIQRTFLGSTSSLLPSEVSIIAENSSFSLGPETEPDNPHRYITINCSVESEVGGRKYDFNIRTAVTPRVIFPISD